MARGLLRGELRKAKRRKSASVMVVLGLGLAVFLIDYALREPDMPLPDPGTDLVCAVREVADGDTLTASCPDGKLRVRVWGIDAPETGQQPWGDDSARHLHALLGRSDHIQIQVVDTDRYGRSVARLFIGERDLGWQMVRDGQAVVYDQYNDSQGYYDAQSEARDERLGVWAEPGDHQDPAAWRRLNPR
jgi:endonuclease YncB( thermonuclease family)